MTPTATETIRELKAARMALTTLELRALAGPEHMTEDDLRLAENALRQGADWCYQQRTGKPRLEIVK